MKLDGWSVVIVVGILGACYLAELRRRDDIAAARTEIAKLRAVAESAPPRDPLIPELAQRTEWLREVLRVLVREELIEGRAELPDPPPGWAPIELLPEEGDVKNTGKRAWREALR